MTEKTFRKKLNEGDIQYKGFDITILPNWKSDGKTCLAWNNKKEFRGTESEIFNLISIK